ncbi:NUD1 [Candida theae]|uniref:NUD1 n=1 Tax=Candida theae TaxID=1198502 RepID=A0AAD5BGN2_9ASCO|nr:NUD1 [Candida theae]KAI5961478.1 NUD1 [Candida theae]
MRGSQIMARKGSDMSGQVAELQDSRQQRDTTQDVRDDNSPPNKSNFDAIHSTQKTGNIKQSQSQSQSQPQQSFLNPRQPSVYQKRVSYIPNTNFSGNKSSLLIQDNDDSPQPSVPNTFHYKSHPNAKSKELGGSMLADDDHQNSVHHNSQASGATPQWMPEVLGDKWIQSSAINEPTTNTGPSTLNRNIKSMEFQPSSTVIHNSDLQMNENLPWKPTAESPAEKNLRGIFQNSKELSTKEESTSSVTSTPIVGTTGRRASRLPVAFSLNELKPQSPLKLYNDNYNTFTRNKLEGVLQNIASNKNTPAQANDRPSRPSAKGSVWQNPPLIENAQTTNIPPKLSIKDFTKSREYTSSAYKANADDVFSRLMKKGPKGHIEQLRNVSKETATSTPKKVSPEFAEENQETQYSSFSTGYNSDDNSAPVDANARSHQVSDEFTSITNNSETKSKSKVEMNGGGSDITYDSPSELAEEVANVQGPLYTQDLTNSHTSECTQSKSSQNRDTNRSDSLGTSSIHSEENDSVGTIQLKSSSKLRGKFITPLVNGKVEPDISLSQEYPGMVYDPVNLKWISTGQQNVTLDDIADLTDDEAELTGILKKKTNKARKGKFEVSFQDPDSFHRDEGHRDSAFVAGDVTKLSQLLDTSFSESRRRLVSTLTDVLESELEVSSWEEVECIDLSQRKLSSLVDLFQFLPKLRKLNAASNDIKYLAGLPSSIVDLDLSHNKVEDRSSFSELRDLHHLVLEHNLLTETLNLCRNINLTVLGLSHNNIDDISGLKSLSNLFYLDLSFNKLQVLNMHDFELPHLQELNVSNNSISEIDGIEHLISLRILNCNKNQIAKVNFTNTSMRKLLLNQNKLSCLDLRGLRQLYCVRFDGNSVSKVHFPAGNHIESISMKSQPHMSQIWDSTAPQCDQLRRLDLSGNRLIPSTVFPFISDLNLSAVNMRQLPPDFAQLFPNVQYLNLSFNKLESIEPLSDLQRLKKLWLVSNRLTNVRLTMKHLQNCKHELVLLDQRLNSFTKVFYDYVFTPNEADFEIELATVDDIEGFTERLDELDRTREWEDRDVLFQSELGRRGNLSTINERNVYQSSVVLFFKHLKSLDGITISNAFREAAYQLRKKIRSRKSI